MLSQVKFTETGLCRVAGFSTGAVQLLVALVELLNKLGRR